MENSLGSFFVLKKTKYSESDLIIQALSHQGERVSFLARGALNSKKRFGGGVLEPTHLVECLYQNSKQENGLKVLKEAKILEAFEFLRKDYDLLELALFALDCVYRVSLEGDQQSQVVFQLLGHFFHCLGQTCDIQILKTQFIIKLLYQQGVLTPEPWMIPYLKTSLHDSVRLVDLKEKDLSSLKNLERSIHSYIHTADPG